MVQPMQARTTISDIATALGISRNTVSKALNNSALVSADTKKKILDKAIEMDYKSMGAVQQLGKQVPSDAHVLLLCKETQLTNGFFAPLIQALHQCVHDRGVTMTTQFLLKNEIDQMVIPAFLNSADAVIALDLLEANYVSRLLSSGKPFAFFDFCGKGEAFPGSYDIVLEDAHALTGMVDTLYAKGARTFGFIGEPSHCVGFDERYCQFCLALVHHGIVNWLDYSVLEMIMYLPFDRQMSYFSHMKLPDVFVCANDYIAHHLLTILRRLGTAVPERVQIIGFDNVHESLLCTPPLTTVSTNSADIAEAMVCALFDRIQNPRLATRRICAATEPVYRKSTR